jgi:hypothetical protein
MKSNHSSSEKYTNCTAGWPNTANGFADATPFDAYGSAPNSDPREALPEDWTDSDESTIREYLKENLDKHLPRYKAPDYLLQRIKRAIEEDGSRR